MNNAEAIYRLGKLQGRFMKLVADLESAKLLLQGAYAPQLDPQEEEDASRIIRIFGRGKVNKHGSLSRPDAGGVQPKKN